MAVIVNESRSVMRQTKAEVGECNPYSLLGGPADRVENGGVVSRFVLRPNDQSERCLMKTRIGYPE